MTRQHFEAIAATIAAFDTTPGYRNMIARDMATTLARFNPHFNRARFLKACGHTD